MLRAAELIGKQASTFSTMSSGLGGFAALDFTNAMPTYNFNIDYAPPEITDAGATPNVTDAGGSEFGGLSRFSSDFGTFESAEAEKQEVGVKIREEIKNNGVIIVNDGDDRPLWARQDRYASLSHDRVPGVEKRDSEANDHGAMSDQRQKPSGDDDWFTEETVPSAHSGKAGVSNVFLLHPLPGSEIDSNILTMPFSNTMCLGQYNFLTRRPLDPSTDAESIGGRTTPRCPTPCTFSGRPGGRRVWRV
jgi:hypothetical protein